MTNKKEELCIQHYYDVVWLLHRIDLVRRIVSEQTARQAGIRRERFPVLHYIHTHDGCTQCEIAQVHRISPASVAISLKRMEKDGLIFRQCDSEDRRFNHLHLTDAGKHYLSKCYQMFNKLDEKMFEGFSNSELDTLSTLVSRLIQNLGGKELEEMSFPDIIALSRELEKSQEDPR